MFLANLNPRAVLYEDNDPGIEVALQLYDVIILLPVTYVRHS